MPRFLLLFFSFFVFLFAEAQTPSSINYLQLEWERQARLDSLQDSTLRAQDSLKMLWIGAPDKKRPNLFLDSIKKSRTVNSGSFSEWKRVFQPEETGKILAESKPVRLRWVLEVYFLLLVLFSVIRIYYSTQLRSMMHAFFNNTVLQQLNKEENVYNKWPFVFLFVLFSFVSGMFFYLGFAAQFNISFSNPLQFFLLISGLVFLYVLFKVWITKALGFIFEVKSVSKEYVSVVYLCYFNGALLLLPINFIFLFSSAQVSAISFIISCVLLTSLFLFQVLRLSLSILKVHKFSKFYLILYFCTLEIGPILLLYKLLDYNLL